MPYIVSYCMRWWSLLSLRRTPDLRVVAGNAASVSVVVGEGHAQTNVVSKRSQDPRPETSAILVGEMPQDERNMSAQTVDPVPKLPGT